MGNLSEGIGCSYDTARCKAKVSAVVPEIRLRRYVHGRVVPATTIEHDPTRFLMGTEGGGATACSTHGLLQTDKSYWS
jgi:hypothetical protein